MDNQEKNIEEKSTSNVSKNDLGKIGSAVVTGYKKVEDTVVTGYKKTEDFFVEHLFTKKGETVEQAKERLKQQNPQNNK